MRPREMRPRLKPQLIRRKARLDDPCHWADAAKYDALCCACYPDTGTDVGPMKPWCRLDSEVFNTGEYDGEGLESVGFNGVYHPEFANGKPSKRRRQCTGGAVRPDGLGWRRRLIAPGWASPRRGCRRIPSRGRGPRPAGSPRRGDPRPGRRRRRGSRRVPAWP